MFDPDSEFSYTTLPTKLRALARRTATMFSAPRDDCQ
jgi:hypothetical protein